MARPGCGLELAGQMLPHERRFLSWLWFSTSRRASRLDLARRIRLRVSDAYQADHRMLDLYKKFRDIWGILAAYREGFGSNGEPVDRFVMATERLEADLAYLRDQGIDTVVSLMDPPLEPEALEPFGVEVFHLPFPDKEAPTQEQIDQFVVFVDEKLKGGHRVLAHCLGGYGRTGTMLACYLVYRGQTAAEALAEVRQKRPGSVETETQEAAIFTFEERLR